MPDEMDLVQERVAVLTDTLVKVRKSVGGLSTLTCTDCAAPIPEQRRAAMPGCRLCLDCQEDAE